MAEENLKVVYKPKADKQIFRIIKFVDEKGYPETALKFGKNCINSDSLLQHSLINFLFAGMQGLQNVNYIALCLNTTMFLFTKPSVRIL